MEERGRRRGAERWEEEGSRVRLFVSGVSLLGIRQNLAIDD